ncbi:hypothetical protein [Fredinandcohnia quinoae]|uniref:Small peptidoglycan-associated lipoprotein n=1 Tax=Fredinandcohnia quinoae TaxID=2918902 RepID=A0AAW5DTG0_9BACI|nr:hypothetical protein [Fredinandcohnia sp. SECRCQ15]MCH1623942.1 hypothetical protein [Fredinandcohnia sp. SECRCQ15]
MRTIAMLLFCLFILSSCQLNSIQSQTEKLENSNEKQIFFFSDEENLHKEGNYYDALLELKKTFPVEIGKMKVISTDDSQMNSKFNIKEYPSILIVYENKVVKKIQGNITTSEIIIPIEDTLSKINVN